MSCISGSLPEMQVLYPGRGSVLETLRCIYSVTPFVRGFEAETSGDKGGLESRFSCPGAKDNSVDSVRPAAMRLWNLPYTAKEGTTAPIHTGLTHDHSKGQRSKSSLSAQRWPKAAHC